MFDWRLLACLLADNGVLGNVLAEAEASGKGTLRSPRREKESHDEDGIGCYEA